MLDSFNPPRGKTTNRRAVCRENRMSGSEGGETGYTTGLSYPYRTLTFDRTFVASYRQSMVLFQARLALSHPIHRTT